MVSMCGGLGRFLLYLLVPPALAHVVLSSLHPQTGPCRRIAC